MSTPKARGQALGKGCIFVIIASNVVLWTGFLAAAYAAGGPEAAVEVLRFLIGIAAVSGLGVVAVAFVMAVNNINLNLPKILTALETQNTLLQEANQRLQSLADNTQLTAEEINKLRRQVAQPRPPS